MLPSLSHQLKIIVTSCNYNGGIINLTIVTLYLNPVPPLSTLYTSPLPLNPVLPLSTPYLPPQSRTSPLNPLPPSIPYLPSQPHTSPLNPILPLSTLYLLSQLMPVIECTCCCVLMIMQELHQSFLHGIVLQASRYLLHDV